MLPMPVRSSARTPSVRRTGAPVSTQDRLKRARYALLAVGVVCALYMLRFVHSKCDTRAPMAELLTKTTTILQRNNVEYWLDKGTLLGVHRDHGLIPWEYDVDLGVMNSTCDEISRLKSEFTAVGLTAYDRSDYIPHKVKLTYDTENHHFYWSDPFMHDPCIRVYDTTDVSKWVDIYWYVELDARHVAANRENILVPPEYDWESELLCCSEGLKEYTDAMCCGGCVPKNAVFPLQKTHVSVSDGANPVQLQYIPKQVPEFLSIQYGKSALSSREIKGWKGVVCGYWTHPWLFAFEIFLLVAFLAAIVVWRRRRAAASAKSQRFKRRNMCCDPNITKAAETEELSKPKRSLLVFVVGSHIQIGHQTRGNPMEDPLSTPTVARTHEDRDASVDDTSADAGMMSPPSSPSHKSSMSPRSSPKRLRSRMSRRDSSDDLRSRLKNDLYLTKEFIDFDVMKGSAFFHTKPANHDKKLVKEGFRRALLVPFHPQFWRQKPWFYEVTTALYVLHSVAIVVYFSFPASMTPFSTFEVAFPVCMLVLVAMGYGRVVSILQTGDSDPSVNIYSPTHKHSNASSATPGTPAGRNVSSPASPLHTSPPIPPMSPLGLNGLNSEAVTGTGTATASALGSDIAESEESDSTDSDDESGNSSSSSDETAPDDQTASFAAGTTPRSMPTTPGGFMETPMSPRTPRMQGLDPTTSADTFARRRVTVCVWENGLPRKKAMSVTELRNTILAKVKATPPREVYRKIAYVASITVALVPLAMRALLMCQEVECLATLQDPLAALVGIFTLWRDWTSPARLFDFVSTLSGGASLVSISCMLSTYYLAFITFAALADAEVTYHRRLMYAKCFTALTSARRSRLNNLPHFRLKNVVNIKAWISLRGGRTWLKRQSRQRAADEIVSTSFLINLVLLVVMGMQAVSEPSSSSNATQNSLLRLEVASWCLLSSIFMLRFMMLGSNINKKYQNTSLLLTEQMNVYLRLLVKPHKKEKLLVSNNVLKLASKLLKELNSPNKVSGLTMNPLLYNITRVVVLSAFSSTASEFFGFKLKLWKMKV